MRVLLVQIAGDYREAWNRLNRGGPETYRAQRAHVQTVEDLAQKYDAVGQLTYWTDEAFDEVLPNRVRAIGMGQSGRFDDESVIAKIEEFKPDRLVIRHLNPPILEWATRNTKTTRSMVLCAESRKKSLRQWWRNRRLARLLNIPAIEWAGNHQLNAARWMQRIGVSPEKIVPWDFEYADTPESYPAKTLRPAADYEVSFVGSVTEGKGVAEILTAVRELNLARFPLRARLAGAGEVDRYRSMAKEMDIADRVEFVGQIGNEQVLGQMRQSDLVVVPSRHNYTEGFPLTILEGLVSRTPVIVSDHPMFREKIVDGRSGLVFPARDGHKLAETIRRALSDPDLYHQLSVGGAETWKALQIPCRWGDVLRHWLDDTPESRTWLHQHRLASGIYP